MLTELLDSLLFFVGPGKGAQAEPLRVDEDGGYLRNTEILRQFRVGIRIDNYHLDVPFFFIC